MATYKQIFGKQIKFLSSDPTNESEGQIWYNSTSGTFKSTLVSEAWSSGSSLTTARQFAASAGIPTAGVIAGGQIPANTDLTEEYNGSGWSASGALNTARGQFLIGTGTQTAALAASGYVAGNVTNSEEYNGASWANGNVVNTARREGGGAGTQGAAVAFGGLDPGPSYTNVTEEYDGTNWTTSPGTLTQGRNQLLGSGTQTAALSAGGYLAPGYSIVTDEYDGSTWTAGTSLPTATGSIVGSGTQTATIGYGGGTDPGVTAAAYKYDGTTWTTGTSMATARQSLNRVGTTNVAALAVGGYTTTFVGVTEEYNATANVITAGAWAAGGNMLDGIQVQAGGFGLQTAAVQVGGQINPAPPYMTNATGKYDGTSWTASGVYPEARGGIGTTGTQTAAVAFGGTPDFASFVTAANEYDGSTWTAATAYPVAYRLVCGVGPQTAALAATGDSWPASPRYSSLCNDYNGTSWTAAAANTGSARYAAMAAGTQTAAAICGGTSPGSGTTEEFNGASWTVGGANLANKSAGGATKSGTSDDWLLFATNDALCTGYDGTAWSTRPNLGTARYDTGGAGTASAGLAFGGGPNSSQTNSTEEFTPEASAVNYKTITTS